MHLTRRVQLQLAFFTIITVVAGGIMAFGYLGLPNLLFGVGHYGVTLNLPAAGGLYENANVTYRGIEVGRVQRVSLSATGVNAVLSLQSGIDIPADLDAQIHSQSAVGEQFVELVPRSGNGPVLKNGSVIPMTRAKLPPDLNDLLAAANRGLQAIPHDNLRTVIDESYTAVGGLGPELRRTVDGITELSARARANLNSLTTLVDQSPPVLNSQIDTSDAIQAWAANIANVTDQVRSQDSSLNGVLSKGPAATEATRALLDRLQPTLPIIFANLVGIAQVGITYQANLEQILVLLPPLVEIIQGGELAQRDTKQDYRGVFLSFNLNLNVPPPCTTGFLPAQQRRSPSEVDYPQRPDGDIYCRIPQDSWKDVRGARNIPCETRPGKRAPTVKMCESDEVYIPLNDGFNWKGDPNATITGQAIPQPPPGPPGSIPPPPTPPIAAAQYDPGTGSYIGPDGKRYTQSDLARDAQEGKTWQSMLVPPTHQ